VRDEVLFKCQYIIKSKYTIVFGGSIRSFLVSLSKFPISEVKKSKRDRGGDGGITHSPGRDLNNVVVADARRTLRPGK
jgi:hypothetical protein